MNTLAKIGVGIGVLGLSAGAYIGAHEMSKSDPTLAERRAAATKELATTNSEIAAQNDEAFTICLPVGKKAVEGALSSKLNGDTDMQKAADIVSQYNGAEGDKLAQDKFNECVHTMLGENVEVQKVDAQVAFNGTHLDVTVNTVG